MQKRVAIIGAGFAGSITAVTVGDGGAAGNILQETDAVALNVQDAIKWGKFTFTTDCI